MVRRRQKNRKLWLEVKFHAPGIQDQAHHNFVRDTLINSVRRGDYSYPRDWKVGIYWRNKANEPWRSGEFTREMRNSAAASLGWDLAVLEYLRRS